VKETTHNPAVLPILEELRWLRKDLSRNEWREGGHADTKQGRRLAVLNALEAWVLQVPPIGSMINTMNQQAQVLASAMKSLNRLQLTMGENNDDDDDDNGDDDTTDVTSEHLPSTKGE
jgi:hypothetical protein